MDAIEAVGYLGSALVAASMMMRRIRRLRRVNLAGCAAFAVYGALISAWPIVAVNVFIAGVNAWHLAAVARRKDAFTFVEVSPETPFLAQVLHYHWEDIRRLFPDLTAEALDRCRIRLVARNTHPVGIFACEVKEDGTAEVRLDYVAPEYRDYRNARFVYSAPHEDLKAAGAHTFSARTRVPAHRRYLLRVGFVPDPEEPGRYLRPI